MPTDPPLALPNPRPWPWPVLPLPGSAPLTRGSATCSAPPRRKGTGRALPPKLSPYFRRGHQLRGPPSRDRKLPPLFPVAQSPGMAPQPWHRSLGSRALFKDGNRKSRSPGGSRCFPAPVPGEASWVGKTYELLNCDKHKSILLKNGRDPGEVRPDIAHQSLLMLMDSPLNRAGLLQVYIHTQKNVLIEVNPQTRIPRTFDRFCGLMVQLLHKLSVRAADGPQKLLKVIKNPVSDHFPAGCMKIGTSFSVPVVSDIKELVPSSDPIVFVVGAFAHGSVPCCQVISGLLSRP
ncbi:ribosomal RNA small subunit methyltransferase NEP1 isoform X2 [Phascolarctos cinereus]